ncbi:adenylyltransferase/cytidyltransferase family protein [Alloalcanivorax gelatiniphagus]
MSKIVGYAPGVYDLFHIGHLNILRHAKERCDTLIAGVVSDEMCRHAKGHTPFIPLIERLEIVRHVAFVDGVHAETVPDKLDTWEVLHFDRIFKGDDWRGTPKGDRLEADFAPLGVEVVYLPYTAHTSSTELRRALSAMSAMSAAHRVVPAPAPGAAESGQR